MAVNRDTPARLGEHLVACGLVTRAQWDEAVARSGSGAARDALNILSRARAHWAPDTDRSLVPALTRYQIEQLDGWLAAPHGEFPRTRLVWNDYLLLDKLAAGGMGVVFKGWCTARRRYVAIKRTLSDSGDLQRRLKRESDLLRQLHHDSVAEFYARETFEDDNLLVMEFVPGKTLLDAVRDRAAKKSPVLWESVAEWAVDLLGALDHLNGHNGAGVVMVHRDIKPSNVMLRFDGPRPRAVLVDFGLARAAKVGDAPEGAEGAFGAELTKQYQFLGTPEYAAPEQWNGGRHAQPASDVYSLGGTLYFALTGRPPFGTMPEDAANLMAAMMQMMNRHRTYPRPGVADLRADVPRALENLLRRMMSVEPERRGDPAELRARFEELLASPGPLVGAEPARKPEVAPAPAPSRAPVAAPPARSGPVAAPPPRPAPPVAVPPPAAPPQPRSPVPSSGPVPAPARRPEPLPVPTAPRRAEPPVAPVAAAPAAPARAPDAPIYGLADPAAAPVAPAPPGDPGTGSGTQKRKRGSRAAAALAQPDADAAVEAAEPPTPATAAVFAAMFEWLGAQLGGTRRGSAARLRGEFLRQCGAWLRAFARPWSHPGRALFLLGSVVLVGLIVGWDWAFLPLVVVGLLVVFAFLADE